MSAALAPYPWLQFLDGSGTPYPNAELWTYVAGTTTPLETYSDADLATPNSNPVVADSEGVFGPIYLSPESYYKFILVEEGSSPLTPLRTQDDIGSPGDYFAANFGTAMGVGTKNVTTGYTVLVTDRLVTTNPSTGAAIVNLPAASTFTSDVTVKSFHASTVTLTPNGVDTIDTNSTWVLEAAADPNFPAVTLRPVTGGWMIVSSHRAA